MKRKVLDFSAQLALAVIVCCSALFVGCKDDDDVDKEGTSPVYYIGGVVTDRITGNALKDVEVKVTGDIVAVKTDDEGTFTIELGAITPAKDGYTLTYTLSKYATETKKVTVKTVEEGVASITYANIALLLEGVDAESQAAKPAEEATTVKNETVLADVAKDIEKVSNAVFTEEVKEELKEEIAEAIKEISGDAGKITIGETEVKVTEDGGIEATVPVTFEKAIAATIVTYPYPVTTGFEVVGDIKEVAPPTTRAIGDVITDPTIIAYFKSSVANELKLSEGFKTTSGTVDYPVPTGYGVVGYKIVSSIEVKQHTYIISGQRLGGKSSTYTKTDVIPLYESHNGDSHDQHGSNKNAGGGSSTD